MSSSSQASASPSPLQVLEAMTRNIPKLKAQNQTNYTQWKTVIAHSIKTAALWGYIDGSIEQPSVQYTSELAKYMDEAGAVRNAILGSLDSEAQKYIEESLSPRDAWLALEKQYLPSRDDSHLIFIERQLADLKLEEGGDVVEHIANFSRLRRHMDGTRLALDDRASIGMLYRSLPTDYREWILDEAEVENFELLCNRLEAHYRSLIGNNLGIPDYVDSDTIAADDSRGWGVPEDIKAFGLTGDKNPLLEKRAAATCRDCLLEGHRAGTSECPQYVWRRELWGSPLEDENHATSSRKSSVTEPPIQAQSDQSPTMSTFIPLPPRNTGIRPNNTGSRDFHSYIKLAYEFSEPVKVALSFDELNSKADLIKALNRYGVRVPYGIQQCAVLPAINGRNVIAQAPSKAGKSIAVAISLAQLTDAYERGVQALIISPTEQKAIDIESIIGSLGHKCYRSRNNQPVEHDLAQIAAGYNCPILLGTPQRVLYLLRRNILHTSELKIMALDDLDTLLDNGFNLQISEIYQLLPRSVRTLCTGSNLSSDALREAHRYMSNPILLNVGKDNRVLSTTSHSFIIIPSTHKFSMLYGLLKNTSVRRQVVILCDTFDEVEEFSGVECCSLVCANMDLNERRAVIEGFRANTSGHLVTTMSTHLGGIPRDQSNQWIVSYNIPSSPENYVEKISYLGGGNGNNMAVTLVNEGTNEIAVIREIERYFDIQMVQLSWEEINLC